MKFYYVLIGALLLILSGCTTLQKPIISHLAYPRIFSVMDYYSNGSGLKKLIDGGISIQNYNLFSGSDDLRFTEYQKGTGCIIYDDGGVNGDISCFNQSGYLHQYDVKKWHISVSGSSDLRPDVNLGILELNPETPLVISGDRLYDRSLLDRSILNSYKAEAYIEYNNTDNQTPEQIIDSLNKGLKETGLSGEDLIHLMDNSDGYYNYVTSVVTGSDIIYGQIIREPFTTNVFYLFSSKYPEFYYKFVESDCSGAGSKCSIFGRGTRLFVDN